MTACQEGHYPSDSTCLTVQLQGAAEAGSLTASGVVWAQHCQPSDIMSSLLETRGRRPSQARKAKGLWHKMDHLQTWFVSWFLQRGEVWLVATKKTIAVGAAFYRAGGK